MKPETHDYKGKVRMITAATNAKIEFVCPVCIEKEGKVSTIFHLFSYGRKRPSEGISVHANCNEGHDLVVDVSACESHVNIKITELPDDPEMPEF